GGKLSGRAGGAGDKFKFTANDGGREGQPRKPRVGGADEQGPEPARASHASAPRERRRRPKPPGRRKKAAPAAPSAAGNSSAGEPGHAATPTQPSPLDLIDRLFDLAKECGGFEPLKRLVDRCAELEGRRA